MLLNEIKQIFELDDTPFADAVDKLQSHISRGIDRAKGNKEEGTIEKIDPKLTELVRAIISTNPVTAAPLLAHIRPPMTAEKAIEAINSMRASNNSISINGVMSGIKDLAKLKTYCTSIRESNPQTWMQKIKTESKSPSFTSHAAYTALDSAIGTKIDQILKELLDPAVAKSYRDDFVNARKRDDINTAVTPDALGIDVRTWIQMLGIIDRRLENAKTLITPTTPPAP